MQYHSNKYHAKKVETPDGTFDSKKEAMRWYELKLMEKAGEIHFLRRQVRFELIPKQESSHGTVRAVHYIADFCYEQSGEMVVEDVKGMKTDVYMLKKKLMLWRHGIEIREV